MEFYRVFFIQYAAMQEPAMKLARVLTECTLSHFPIISITQASPFFLGRSPSIRMLLMGMMATLVQGNTRAVVRAATRSKSFSLVLSRYQPTQYQVTPPHSLTPHTLLSKHFPVSPESVPRAASVACWFFALGKVAWK